MCDPASGHRAGQSPRRRAAEWGERHVAHEQEAGGGTHLGADQRADDGAWGAGHGLLFGLSGDFRHSGGFVRRRRNPPAPRVLQGFLRERRGRVSEWHWYAPRTATGYVISS